MSQTDALTIKPEKINFKGIRTLRKKGIGKKENRKIGKLERRKSSKKENQERRNRERSILGSSEIGKSNWNREIGKRGNCIK